MFLAKLKIFSIVSIGPSIITPKGRYTKIALPGQPSIITPNPSPWLSIYLQKY